MATSGSSPGTECPSCLRLRAQLDDALAKIAVLEARGLQLEAMVRDLSVQVNRNSSNSSLPPSANPPGAPKPPPKRPSGRRPGGQPGHSGRSRTRLPASRVDQVVAHLPHTCQGCQAPLPAQAGPNDPEPTWHQVVELPVIAAHVTEHQGHARTCPQCGLLNRAPIPDHVRAHVVGPRLAAILSYLSGRFHLSKRAVREFAEAVFQAPISLGTIITLERQTCAALAQAHDQARAAVRAAAVKNADETGWKLAGQRRWLWTATTATVAFFVIHIQRGKQGLKALLGEAILGVVISDRWSAYHGLPWDQRQICWAHLKRDFQKCVERGGVGKMVGQSGLAVAEDVFTLWWDFRQRRIDRASLQDQLEAPAAELHEALVRGSGCADRKVATFCEDLLAILPALWTFAAVEGVEPTNNPAERTVRLAVLWRKNAFGCQSESGCRFVERMLTVVQTLRLQKRPVLEFLIESVAANRLRTPGPALIVPEQG